MGVVATLGAADMRPRPGCIVVFNEDIILRTVVRHYDMCDSFDMPILHEGTLALILALEKDISGVTHIRLLSSDGSTGWTANMRFEVAV